MTDRFEKPTSMNDFVIHFIIHSVICVYDLIF